MIPPVTGSWTRGERGAGCRRGFRFAGRCQGSVLLSDAAPYHAQAWSITPYLPNAAPKACYPFFTYSSSEDLSVAL